jgi:predicted dinucleotide-binding enzyme
VVVVDTGNYYPRQRDGVIPEIEAGLPESRWVERQIGRRVVKAFNNISAKPDGERAPSQRCQAHRAAGVRGRSKSESGCHEE